LIRALGSQPAHSNVLGALSQLCVETASNFESALARQKEFDRTEARRQEEEQRRWEELVKEAAEQVQQEKFRAMERERQEIESAEPENMLSTGNTVRRTGLPNREREPVVIGGSIGIINYPCTCYALPCRIAASQPLAMLSSDMIT
jgi:hypothetical protein